MKAAITQTIARAPDDPHLIESLRVVHAFIAGLLLIERYPEIHVTLSATVVAFGIYAVILLVFIANHAFTAQRRIFYWLDACWFLLLMFLAEGSSTYFFLFLFFRFFLLPGASVTAIASNSRCSA